jgi:hypothetical protein
MRAQGHETPDQQYDLNALLSELLGEYRRYHLKALKICSRKAAECAGVDAESARQSLSHS